MGHQVHQSWNLADIQDAGEREYISFVVAVVLLYCKVVAMKESESLGMARCNVKDEYWPTILKVVIQGIAIKHLD